VAFIKVLGMSALHEDGVTEPPSADVLVGCLDEMLEKLAEAITNGSPTPDAVRIDRIARLERLRAVTAAAQAAESVRCGQSQVAEQVAAEVHPDAIGRGIAEQIGLACRAGPIVGGDPTRRCFDCRLAELIKLRDHTCRTPDCGAPIRHIDHITRHTDGGPTSYSNGTRRLRTLQLCPRNARLGGSPSSTPASSTKPTA
jgi:hypothetical protein